MSDTDDDDEEVPIDVRFANDIDKKGRKARHRANIDSPADKVDTTDTEEELEEEDENAVAVVNPPSAPALPRIEQPQGMPTEIWEGIDIQDRLELAEALQKDPRGYKSWLRPVKSAMQKHKKEPIW